jgi:hypothetical protein
MALVKTVQMNIVADPGDAQAQLSDISAKAEELAKPFSLNIVADTGEAQGEVDAVTDALSEYIDASLKAEQASAKLAEVQADESSTAADLSAAMDANTEATIGAADAQMRLLAAEEEAATGSAANADAQEDSAAKTDTAAASAEGASGKLKLLALGAGAVAVGSVYMAMKWQEASTQLVTGAGQSEKGLKQVQAGMLAVSMQTATSASQVQSGMYMIESAGYHGAAGLDVLKAAAEGAKVGNADLGDVANVVTSALNAYHLPASQAVAVTDELVTTVASGKMHMQDLATSIANVLPVAASAHLSFAQVGGALATMTAQGMTARRASMNLANEIRSLLDPSAAASEEMAALGLNANTVSSHLGSEGLTGTLDELTNAILKNTSGGSVLVGYMNQMTPAARSLAQQILAGSISTGTLTNDVKTLNPEQAKLISLFDTSATSATGLKQSYDAALAKMTGGATGLNVALMLGGKNASTFKSNVDAVAGSAAHAGKDVQGWGDVTKDASFQLEDAKDSAQDLGITVGTVLLPKVIDILHPIDDFVGGVARSKTETDILVGVLVGGLAAYALVKTVSAVKSLSGAVSDVGKFFSRFSFFTEESTTATEANTAVTEESVAAKEEATAATEEETAAQVENDAAMDANPIGLIVLAIAALIIIIIEVVKHWKDFRQWGLDAFHDVEGAAEDAYHGIDKAWGVIYSILTEPFRLAVTLIDDEYSMITRGAEDTIHDVTSFFEGLPGDVMGAVDSLGSTLYNAGVHFIENLASGISAVASAPVHAVEGIVHDITDLIPGSPAKKGPLSGSGWSYIRGLHFAQDLARGITDGASSASAASEKLAQGTAQAIGTATAAGGSGGGGDTYIFNVAPLVDPQKTAREIQQMLLTLKRNKGFVANTGAGLGLA